MGNTCYMNSCVQCLYAVPELREALDSVPGSATGTALANQASSLFKQMAQGGTVTPMMFLMALRHVAPQFDQMGDVSKQSGQRVHAQQDAEECWSAVRQSSSEYMLRRSGQTCPNMCTRIRFEYISTELPSSRILSEASTSIHCSSEAWSVSRYMPGCVTLARIAHPASTCATQALHRYIRRCSVRMPSHTEGCVQMMNSWRPALRTSASDPIRDLFGFDTITELKCTESYETFTETASQLMLKCNISQEVSHLSEGIKLGLNADLEKASDALGRSALWRGESKIARLSSYFTMQIMRFYYKVQTQSRAKISRKVCAQHADTLLVVPPCCMRYPPARTSVLKYGAVRLHTSAVLHHACQIARLLCASQRNCVQLPSRGLRLQSTCH